MIFNVKLYSECKATHYNSHSGPQGPPGVPGPRGARGRRGRIAGYQVTAVAGIAQANLDK